MSPSKKANKKVSKKKSIVARKVIKKTSTRSSRAKTASRNIPSSLHISSGQIAQSTKVLTPPPATVHVSNLQTNILRGIALITVVFITWYVFSIRERVEEFTAFGYPGIFLVALLANATILLPAPGVAVIYAMGAVFNPLGVGLAAGTGGAIGELSGYLAGFGGQAVIERTDVYERTKPWVDKYGGWAILVLAAIPNPFFDAAGVAAGIAKMPLRTFLFFVWIGQLIKMTLFAYAGRYSLEWLTRFIG